MIKKLLIAWTVTTIIISGMFIKTIEQLKEELKESPTHFIIYDEYNNEKTSYSGICYLDEDGCLIITEALRQNTEKIK